jgi:hypothetical protein
VRTWKERLAKLVELGFIDIKYGLTKDVQFALLLNPYHVIAKAYAAGDVPLEMWNALMVRSAEIGAVTWMMLTRADSTWKEFSQHRRRSPNYLSNVVHEAYDELVTRLRNR